jgi:predicted GIY-YIG superfamily endonuclease
MGGSTYILYRFFSADEQLLYVGMTRNPARRFEKHSGDKSWWGEIARIEMQQFGTIEELRAAERAAIEAEHPVHNIRMNGSRKREAPTSEARKTGRMGLRVGEVYALGLRSGECPVGVVVDVDDEGVSVERMSFMTGCFDCGELWISFCDIASHLRAARMSRQKMELDGWNMCYVDRFIGEMFDTEPLGDFQTEWLNTYKAARSARWQHGESPAAHHHAT